MKHISLRRSPYDLLPHDLRQAARHLANFNEITIGEVSELVQAYHKTTPKDMRPASAKKLIELVLEAIAWSRGIGMLASMHAGNGIATVRIGNRVYVIYDKVPERRLIHRPPKADPYRSAQRYVVSPGKRAWANIVAKRVIRDWWVRNRNQAFPKSLPAAIASTTVTFRMDNMPLRFDEPACVTSSSRTVDAIRLQHTVVFGPGGVNVHFTWGSIRRLRKFGIFAVNRFIPVDVATDQDGNPVRVIALTYVGGGIHMCPLPIEVWREKTCGMAT